MEGDHPQRGRSASNGRVRELTERSPKASSQDRPEALRYCRYHSRNQASAVRVIVDTNVLVSAIFFGRTPGRILDAWRTGQIDLVVSQEIVDEKVSPSCPPDSLWTGGFERVEGFCRREVAQTTPPAQALRRNVPSPWSSSSMNRSW